MIGMMRTVIYIPKNSVARVAGPASLRVVSGKISVVGKILGVNDEATISLYRSYPVYALEDSSIEVLLGESGYIEYPKERDEVSLEWIRVANEITEKGSRIIIMGPVESGKTTLSTLLLNTALSKGLKPCVIDADIGQQDISLPDFVSLSCPREPVIWLRELMPDEIRIIGSLTPSQYSSRIIAATIDLVQRAFERGGEVIIVNTDGWVSHPSAIEMKLDIARYMRATHIIVLQKDLFTTPIENSLVTAKIIKLSSPQNVRTRSREDRKLLRAHAYKKFFENSSMRQIDLRRVLVIGSCLFAGEPLKPEQYQELEKIVNGKIEYGSVLDNTIYLYVRSGEKISPEKQVIRHMGYEINIIPAGAEKGLIISILNRDLREVAPGIIDELRPSEGVMRILTSYQGEIGGVVVGRVKIDSAYDDSTRFSKCVV